MHTVIKVLSATCLVALSPFAHAASAAVSMTNLTFSVSSLFPAEPDPAWSDPDYGWDPSTWTGPSFSYVGQTRGSVDSFTCAGDPNCEHPGPGSSSWQSGSMFRPQSVSTSLAGTTIAPYFVNAFANTAGAPADAGAGGFAYEQLQLAPYTLLTMTVDVTVRASVLKPNTAGGYETATALGSLSLCSEPCDGLSDPPETLEATIDANDRSTDSFLERTERVSMSFANIYYTGATVVAGFSVLTSVHGVDQASAVPEPSTLAAMLAGLGGIALAARRTSGRLSA